MKLASKKDIEAPLSAVWAAIAESKPLPDSRTITPSPRKAGADGLQPLTAESLGL